MAPVVVGGGGGMVEVATPTGHARAGSAPSRVAASGKAWEARARAEGAGVSVSSRVAIGGEPYEGAYEVVPSDEAQTLATRGRTLARDVTVGPIPSNYGLVTWTGAVLTVS